MTNKISNDGFSKLIHLYLLALKLMLFLIIRKINICFNLQKEKVNIFS